MADHYGANRLDNSQQETELMIETVSVRANIIKRLVAIRHQMVELCEITREFSDTAQYYALVELRAQVEGMIRQATHTHCECVRVVCVRQHGNVKIYRCPDCNHSFEIKSQLYEGGA